MRIVMDLQACQTAGSAKRGVGRYSYELFSGILRNNSAYDLRAVVSSCLPHEVDLRAIPENLVLRLPECKNWPTDRVFQGGEQDNLDSLAYTSLVAPLNADIVHVAHAFEGFGDRVALPAKGAMAAGQILSATLYDLIPMLFQDHYFQSPEFRKWYLSRLSWLRGADLLLAISESSRQDAIDLLGIEPWRIVTIHGGIGSHFKPSEDREFLRRDLATRYQLKQRFVLYTGGDDHRKNIGGAIAGFAEVPPAQRRNCQLVVVCAMEPHRQQMYLDMARHAGLDERDVLITGYVPENDLLAFYQTCDALVFPSLYEGLGLPVLEAMACGAPVLGGNNSSIRELIVRPDALFDATSAKSIAAALVKILSDEKFSLDLREYGQKRARDFSWERTASLALQAFEEASARVCSSGIQSAIHGWIPRKRMAVLTPLPPCRSGIADYNAKFLPYLARHFDIDLYVDNYDVSDESLTSSFRIFQVAAFDRVAPNYDVILYEFGNSEFHSHMLPLLEKYPGVVGLHDAYLSGLFGYFDFYLGDTGSYAREMLSAHGPLARRCFAPVMRNPEPNGATMVGLPCTKRILDAATGIISHSPFNLEMAQRFYPEGWPSPYRIISQMVPMPESWTSFRRAEARAALGFRQDDLIITTFGHIAWTKWGDRLLEGFLASRMRKNARVHLVFAGELAKDEFGRQLEASVAKAALGDRIRITGFLSELDYEKYLQIADVAVQLRTKSRGGTPKGVLDCLAHGVPVIVNNDASYRDYPDDVVIKLTAEPTIDEIALALNEISGSETVREAFALAGLDYVRSHHDPAHCAAEYAAAIHEFVERAGRAKPDAFVSAFAPHLATCADSELASQNAADWLESISLPTFARRRVFVDVSHIAQCDHRTGIQRVVREIVRALYCSEHAGFEPIAVELVGGVLQVATAWLDRMGLLLEQEKRSTSTMAPVSFRAGDVLLMLDSSWARYNEFYPVFNEARNSRVPVYTAVYDILPLLLPDGNFVEGGKEWFSGWIANAIVASDGLVCISRAVADDLMTYMKSNPSLTRLPKVGFWHLGSDFSSRAVEGVVTTQVADMATRPYLLIVGTIEPRKSHALALEAMERLWKDGDELCLCIAGKEGWMVSELMERLRNHPLAGKKLFLFEGPSDADIQFLYEHAAGLLFLSKGEGFGLPLIEAANHGTAIVCSDIPVFREIAGDFAIYIDQSSLETATAGIRHWWDASRAGELPDTKLMPRLTWEQSGSALLNVVFDNHWIGSEE